MIEIAGIFTNFQFVNLRYMAYFSKIHKPIIACNVIPLDIFNSYVL